MSNALVRKLKSIAALSVEDVRLVVQASGNARKVLANRDLIREGDQPGPAYVVLEGWACRYKALPDGNRQITALLTPGDFCDLHPAVLSKVDHSIGTITACQIASVPRERMEALTAASPVLARALWLAQLMDEAMLRTWIVNMGRRDSIERMAHLMLELYSRLRSVGLVINHTCAMPLSQTVLADTLGLTPVHVNRVLKTLREHNIMRLGSGVLTICDMAQLISISGFDEKDSCCDVALVA